MGIHHQFAVPVCRQFNAVGRPTHLTSTPAGVGEVVVGDELEGFIEDDSMFSLEVK